MPRVHGFIASQYQAHYVSSSHPLPLCSATSGLNAAHCKKPIAGFPSASHTREALLPAISRIMPIQAGGHFNNAKHPVRQSLTTHMPAVWA